MVTMSWTSTSSHHLHTFEFPPPVMKPLDLLKKRLVHTSQPGSRKEGEAHDWIKGWAVHFRGRWRVVGWWWQLGWWRIYCGSIGKWGNTLSNWTQNTRQLCKGYRTLHKAEVVSFHWKRESVHIFRIYPFAMCIICWFLSRHRFWYGPGWVCKDEHSIYLKVSGKACQKGKCNSCTVDWNLKLVSCQWQKSEENSHAFQQCLSQP